MKSITYSIFLLLFFALQNLQSQDLYPVQNFSPEDYQAETQNWSIAQADDKTVYIANNKGLLVFNGATQKLYPSPNNTIMRSVFVSGNRVYTGCYMEFGFWEKDQFSNLQYTSLSEKIKNKLLPDEHFWNIIGYRQWVIFQSLNRIYIFDTLQENFKIVKSNTNITKLYTVGGQILFQETGKGIYRLESGKAVLISDYPTFKNEVIVNIFDFDNQMLVQTLNKGFFVIKNGTVTPWATASSVKLNAVSVYSSLRLKNGGFVLGTIGKGCFILSADGNVISHIDKKNGLQNNTVLTLFEDADQNIWLGLDDGVSVLNYRSPFRVYFDTNGVFGTVYASARHQGNLYLGTNQGLYVKSDSSSDDFKLVEGTQGQVWMLKVIDNELFCGHNSGTFIVSGNQVKRIADAMGTWDIKPIAEHPNLLLQGNYEGLNVLEKTNGTWHYRNNLEGFHISSRFFEIMPNRQIFVNHEYNGLYQLTINADYRKVVKNEKVESVPRSANSGIVKFQNKLMYFSQSGMYEYDAGRNMFEKNEKLTEQILGYDSYVSGKMINDDNQSLWLFTRDNVINLTAGKISEEPFLQRIPLPLSVRENRVNFENILPKGNDDYLLGTTNGYIVFRLNQIADNEQSVQITSIEKSKKNRNRSFLPIDELKHKLKSSENNVSFSFAVPVFDKFTFVKYQYRLEGMYDQWSEWSDAPTAVFNNLPPGNYTFKVRAKVGNKLTRNVASFHFVIANPWYLSVGMMLVYFLLFIALLWWINRVYDKRFQRKSEQIEREKLLMQLQNEQEIIKLKNDNLNSEVASVNRELASTNMAIVNKNELLNTIRQKLQQGNSSDNIKSTLKIIDENMDTDRDWETFQEAFNNTDRDFLKKLKELHPALTPNDLKLCVYLRLNLASKEIAPLLSISPQSVEVKRFRLRKKLELNRNENLTEYIMGI